MVYAFFPVIQIANGYRYIKKGSTPWDFIGRGWVYQRKIGNFRRFALIAVVILALLAFTVTQKMLKNTAKEELSTQVGM